MRKGLQQTQDGLATPKYQDDSYLVGKVVMMASSWQQLTEAFAADGHELNLRKSEIWIPGCDDIPSTSLPD
eukprot:5126946-Karenia_brevis.AAC.1